MKALAAETGKMFAEEGIAPAAAKYADAPMRQAQKNKDPRGWAEFARMLAEHSATGHAHTMLNLQLKRPTLWEMEAELKRFVPPLLVIVGDEDEPCLEGSVFLEAHGADRRAVGDPAHRPHHHQRGAGRVQRRARRAVCRGRSPAAGWRTRIRLRS